MRAAARQRGLRWETYGQIGAYALPVFSGGDADSDTRIYLSAGIHGDEPAGVYAVQQLLADGFFDRRARWLVCPMLNPTGLANGIRENSQGLDLNRDYRVRRSAEVIAHCAWLAARPPCQLALSLHEDWETGGFYLYEINTSARPCIGPAVLAKTGAVMPAETRGVLDGHQVTAPGYILHPPEADEPCNWPEAIHLTKAQPLLSCTFETPSRLPLPLRVQTHVVAARAAVDEFLAGGV
ncbi:MAG: M14 family metallocarboxypeptidase [Verrucomicrobiales bacterium]|nr:M14 family metallocarboxypeptidase [Verrucomicrobiales bacterium]